MKIPDGDDRIETYETLTEARERFGENYRGFVFPLTRGQAEALLAGRVVAFDIGGREYAGFLMVGSKDDAGVAADGVLR